jgi:hypothetical protein
MTYNKIDWVRDFEEKCKEEFLDSRTCFKEKTFWGLDSFIQVCYGLKMFDENSIHNFIKSKVDGRDIVINAKGDHEFITNEKKKIKQISHKKVLDLIMNK